MDNSLVDTSTQAVLCQDVASIIACRGRRSSSPGCCAWSWSSTCVKWGQSSRESISGILQDFSESWARKPSSIGHRRPSSAIVGHLRRAVGARQCIEGNTNRPGSCIWLAKWARAPSSAVCVQWNELDRPPHDSSAQYWARAVVGGCVGGRWDRRIRKATRL